MSTLSRMQGISGYIEFHKEALPDKSPIKDYTCHYKNGICCKNKKSINYSKYCVGYNACPEFTSAERYFYLQYKDTMMKPKKKNFEKHQRIAKTQTKNAVHNKTSQKQSSSVRVINSSPKNIIAQKNIPQKQIIHKKQSKTNPIPAFAIGNDPRFKNIFQEFNGDQ